MDAMLNAFVLELDPVDAGKVRAKLYRQGRLIPETDDRMGGKVTQPIAAEQLSRTCYGMEIDPKYCDVIIKRYCDYAHVDEASVRATMENPIG